MEIKAFIDNYQEAFGDQSQLPIAFWYSAQAQAQTEKVGGCIFKHLDRIAKGEMVSVDTNNIGCGGGKFYCGFSDMPEYVPQFVSVKERYKQSPELVVNMLAELQVPRAKDNYLNFARVDCLASFQGVEGVLFLATPDILCGLVTWATFDRNEQDTVSSLFGSGCSNVITQAVIENTVGGYRSFIGFFDPSVRPYVASDILSFAIPMSRFRVMCDTMRQSCLFDTHAWGKIRERIISGNT